MGTPPDTVWIRIPKIAMVHSENLLIPKILLRTDHRPQPKATPANCPTTAPLSFRDPSPSRPRHRPSSLRRCVTALIILALTIGYSFGLEALQVSKFAPSISDLLWLLLGGVLLVISFLVGLLFQSPKAGVIPILGFLIGFFLWHTLPWATSSPFTGDAGRFSIVLFPGVPSLLMYFAFLFGRVLR